MACFLVSRHVLEPLIERKPLISEECMLVYKVSNFYINILTMLIRNRTLLQVSLKCMIRFFLKKKTLNELFSFQGSGILTTYMYYQKFEEEEERSFLWLCLYMILAKEEEASLSGASAILKPNHPSSLSKS